MGEIVFLGAILIIGVICGIQTLGFKAIPILDSVVGPALFPQIAIGIVVLGALALIVQLVMKKQKNQFVFLELFQGKRLGFGIVTIAYVLMLDSIGFIVSTAIFLMLAINYLEYIKGIQINRKKTIVVSLCCILFSIIIYYFFSKVMGIMLPRGIVNF